MSQLEKQTNGEVLPKSVIPKKIHYCWFGGKPLPKNAQRYIDSWRKHLPDYEIIRWDESNFDVNGIAYTRDAYADRKYAFVSDYARFKVLYEEGGLYFDTDVELIKSIDDIIERGPFMGCEHKSEPGASPQTLGVAPGLGLGVCAGHPFYKEMIQVYETKEYKATDGTKEPDTVVTITTRQLARHGLKNTDDIQEVEGIWIYPAEYFCPISTEDGKLRLSPTTRSIHYYDQSWQSPIRKYGRRLLLKLGGKRLKDALKPLFLRK